jgi:hypothetical protein
MSAHKEFRNRRAQRGPPQPKKMNHGLPSAAKPQPFELAARERKDRKEKTA